MSVVEVQDTLKLTHVQVGSTLVLIRLMSDPLTLIIIIIIIIIQSFL